MILATRRDVLTLVAASAATAADALPIGTATQTAGRRPAGESIAPYTAVCVRHRVLPVFDQTGRFLREAQERNLDAIVQSIRRGSDETGARLYVFCEFALQLATARVPVQRWLECAIRVPGAETDRIARAAQAARAYVALNVAEFIPAFPNRYFLSGIVIGPDGNIVLNARKLYDLTSKTRPGDLLTAWIERFGVESLFPVARTPIGTLGCVIGADVNWPETARGLAFQGAEVLLNPTASPAAASTDVAPDIRAAVRRVRAFENQAYLLLSNLGPVGAADARAPRDMMPSEIIDHTGRPLAASRDSSEGFISATLDIEALRRARTSMKGSRLAQLQIPLHRPGYERAEFMPVDGFAAAPIESEEEHEAKLRSAIEKLIHRGILQAPAAR